MEISVIVPVDNDPRLARCLEGLLRQSLDRSAYEIVVIGRRDGAMRRLADTYSVKYLVESEGGSYAARNLGIEAAHGKILAFTEAGCLPPSEWLSVICSVFNEGRSDVAIGPCYPLNPNKVGLLIQRVDDQRWDRLAREQWVTYADGRNLAGARDVFLKQPFDAAFPHGGDLDWGLRTARQGYRVLFVPEMALRHDQSLSLPEVRRRNIARGRGVTAVYRKHGAAARISGARPLTLVGTDIKDLVLRTATHPLVRPLSRVVLSTATASLMPLIWGLLLLPGGERSCRRAFQVFDRASLLLGRVLGPST